MVRVRIRFEQAILPKFYILGVIYIVISYVVKLLLILVVLSKIE